MELIRVLFANTSGERSRTLSLLLGAQPDIQLVGNKTHLLESLIAVGEMKADVVIVAASDSGEAPPSVGHLLMEYPGLLIIALGEGATKSCTYRVRIDCTPLADDRDAAILEAIRNICGKAEL